MKSNQKVPSPFVKWVGGKRKLLSVLIPVFTFSGFSSKSKFFEPFLGGGAVTFATGLTDNNSFFVPGARLCVSDVNPDLISTYQIVRSDVENLIDLLTGYEKSNTEVKFNKIRKDKPGTDLERAARFIFLNKTCFNGLWRVNSSGNFNVPFGRYANPKILDPDNLRLCSKRLQGSSIEKLGYAASLERANQGDLVYLDPPYVPLTKTSSFSAYAKDGFGVIEQYALAGVIKGLTERKVDVVLSNSFTPLTLKIYDEMPFKYKVEVNRTMAANSASRKKVSELIATNFEISPRIAGLRKI